jgi:hypothetical protein
VLTTPNSPGFSSRGDGAAPAIPESPFPGCAKGDDNFQTDSELVKGSYYRGGEIIPA